MSSSVILLTLVLVTRQPFPTQSLPSANPHAIKTVILPKPAAGLPVGTWKYQSRDDVPANPNLVNNHSTFSVTIKDSGDSWTLTSAWEFPEGPVTDILTLDKGTLALHKEVFKHFLHPDQRWKPIAIDVDVTGNKATGSMKYVSGEKKPFAVGLSGPVFTVSSVDVTVGSLPLAEGYSTSFRYFDVERLALNPHAPDREKQLELKVAGTEPVTVPAGAFDSWKVELTSPDRSYKETVWIAKDARVPVKTFTVITWKKGDRKGTASTTTEMVP
jgi:hypothetical protein